MRLAILILLAIGLALTSVFVLRIDSGYVLIRVFGISLETSAAVAISVVVLFTGSFYLLARLLARTITLPSELREMRGLSRQEKAQKDLVTGLLQLGEGKWPEAERTLTRKALISKTPLLHYLNAARAAQLQREYVRRDEWLAKARESDPKADLALGIAQAELQILMGEFPQASASLSQLRDADPKHGYVLKLLFRVYLRMQDWNALVGLIPGMRRYELLESADLVEHCREIYPAFFIESAEAIVAGDPHTDEAAALVESVWKDVPKRLKADASVVAAYAQYLHAKQDDSAAGKLIHQTLRQQWNETLVALYGWLHLDVDAQLNQLSQWRDAHGEHPSILLSEARLNQRSDNFVAAQTLLEASIRLQPSRESYEMLGQVMEQLGDGTAAFTAYREAARSDMFESKAGLLPAPAL
ncbi:MAG: HemY protein [Gammaproteobacteria bacterium]|jgi:HemY protein